MVSEDHPTPQFECLCHPFIPSFSFASNIMVERQGEGTTPTRRRWNKVFYGVREGVKGGGVEG